MTVYHGTDLLTARLIIESGSLLGDYPIFGVGFCTQASRARNFACIRVQKFLSKGRAYARKMICVLEFEISEEDFKNASPESVEHAYTMNRNNKPLKELKTTFKIHRK